MIWPFRPRRARRALPTIPRGYDIDLALGNRRLCRKDNQARANKAAETRRRNPDCIARANEIRAAHNMPEIQI
ncbi:hypothetical protein SAMN06295912_15012 [Sphingomonas laterariae]|uniref:Uncharacterized protein n=1 Tax=Edaphosphingomonas laterariae TaxID=861865 RepID=A0A239KCI6_9SPHN|nr:hypothetical protein [Sphingomonas laterariae]SNT15831.1 hypothetical protein SAMN06295912_15012 [Sphingomonas laterariae]